MKKNGMRDFLFFAIVLVLVFTLGWKIIDLTKPPEPIYSDVVAMFESEQIKEINLDGTTLIAEQKSGDVVRYNIQNFEIFYRDVWPTINQQRQDGIITSIKIKAPEGTPWWLEMFPYLLMFGAFAFLWFMIVPRMDGGAGKAAKFGKARVRLGSEERKKVTFADVAGADEEKAELQEIIDFLRDPKKFTTIGARIPKGVLLVGPPGTGKTLIAKAVAGEAGVNFFSISGSDFVELYVGVGASRVRDLFETAKKTAPSIVFIDEIDAVGRRRGAGLGGGHDEREQTLNQLLVEMDGFGNNEGVIVIAATNRADILDPALLRPGRFDRQVYISLPDVKGREEILRVHAKGKPFEPQISLENIAKQTVGFSGADLANLLNESALLAARNGKTAIGDAELQEAMLKVIAGPEKKSRRRNEKELRLTAYHEAGHANVMKRDRKSTRLNSSH